MNQCRHCAIDTDGAVSIAYHRQCQSNSPHLIDPVSLLYNRYRCVSVDRTPPTWMNRCRWHTTDTTNQTVPPFAVSAITYRDQQDRLGSTLSTWLCQCRQNRADTANAGSFQNGSRSILDMLAECNRNSGGGVGTVPSTLEKQCRQHGADTFQISCLDWHHSKLCNALWWISNTLFRA